jgi:hypothetical protein
MAFISIISFTSIPCVSLAQEGTKNIDISQPPEYEEVLQELARVEKGTPCKSGTGPPL